MTCNRSLVFHNKGVNVFVLTKLPSSRFIFDLLLLLLSHFNLLIFSDSLIFLLFYLVSLFNVFGWVAPKLSHFPFMSLYAVQLFWSSRFSLFHLCTLRYNCSFMYKRCQTMNARSNSKSKTNFWELRSLNISENKIRTFCIYWSHYRKIQGKKNS